MVSNDARHWTTIAMPIWIALALQAAPNATFDLAHVRQDDPASASTVITPCHNDSDDEEIVVCAQRRNRYRLPLPEERRQPGDRAGGNAVSGMAALTPAAPCGIFAGSVGAPSARLPSTATAKGATRSRCSPDLSSRPLIPRIKVENAGSETRKFAYFAVVGRPSARGSDPLSVTRDLFSARHLLPSVHISIEGGAEARPCSLPRRLLKRRYLDKAS